MEQNELQQEQQKFDEYPFQIANDSQLINECHISSYMDSTKPNPKSTKFCYICDFPIIVKIVVMPCQHYYCYSCFSINPTECRICDKIITEHIRLNDYEPFFSCEKAKCHKYFANEIQFKEHQKLHAPIQSKN